MIMTAATAGRVVLRSDGLLEPILEIELVKVAKARYIKW